MRTVPSWLSSGRYPAGVAGCRCCLRLAGVLLRQGQPAEARMEAQAALSLADTEEERRDAERLVGIRNQSGRNGRCARSAPPPTVSPADSASAAAAGGASNPSRGAASIPLASREDMQALNKSCHSGDNTACGRLLPVVEAECAQKIPSACGFAGFLYKRGRGVAADAARAARFTGSRVMLATASVAWDLRYCKPEAVA